MALPGTSIASHTQSGGGGGIDDYRYWAPEIQWPEDYGMDKTIITTESDVYGMGMVAYEVSFRCPAPPDLSVISRVNLFPRF